MGNYMNFHLSVPLTDCWKKKTSGRQGNTFDGPSTLVYPDVVSTSPSLVGGDSTSSITEFSNCTTGARVHTYPGQEVSTNSNAAIRQSFENQGLSPEVVNFIFNSWRGSSQLQNGTHVKRWLSVCLDREINPFHPPLISLLDYLLQEFNKFRDTVTAPYEHYMVSHLGHSHYRSDACESVSIADSWRQCSSCIPLSHYCASRRIQT